MNFTITQIHTRPDTNVPFYKHTGFPVISAVVAKIVEMNDAGDITVVPSVDDSDLVLTSHVTFRSLSALETYLGYVEDPKLSVEYLGFVNSHPGYGALKECRKIQN